MVSVEDILGYTNDFLILCTSPNQLREVIRLIKGWSLEDNLKLNPKKSGFIEFLPRYERS